MPKYTVFVPDSGDQRLMTARQWLAEFMVTPKGQRSRVFVLPSPVRLTWVSHDDRERGNITCRRSTALFRQLQQLALNKAVLTSVSWTGHKLAPQGIHALNTALHTVTRAGTTKNIVRGFLEDRQGSRTPMRCDWSALLEYLEIRPIATRQKTRALRPHVPTPTPNE